MEYSSNDRSNEVPIALLPYWAKDVRSHGVRRWCYCVHGVVSEVERKVPALLEDDLSTVKSCEKGIENTRYDECWFFHTFYIRSQRASHDEFLCVVISQISKVASIPSKILNHRIYICFLLEWLITSLLVRWRLSWTAIATSFRFVPSLWKFKVSNSSFKWLNPWMSAWFIIPHQWCGQSKMTCSITSSTIGVFKSNGDK